MKWITPIIASSRHLLMGYIKHQVKLCPQSWCGRSRKKAKMVRQRFEEHNNEFECCLVLTWRPNSPARNPIKDLSDVMDTQVKFIEVPPELFFNAQDRKQCYVVIISLWYFCLFTASWKRTSKPTQAWEEHANSIQKGYLSVRWQC